MSEVLQLSLLGKLQINLAGKLITSFLSAKAQALLCYLTVTGQPHCREVLAGLLWGDMPETEAKANLRQALTNLRKQLAAHLDISREMVSLSQDTPYWLDVQLFEAALTSQRDQGLSISEVLAATRMEPPGKTSEVSLEALRQAVELYQGDFLAGFVVREALAFEEWLLGQRERLRQLALHGLHRLAVEHTARGEFAAGLDYTTRLLALEPWREESHRQMMILLAKSGQRSAALAQYETCRRILAEELGVEPAAETVALYQRLKTMGATRPHNLPPQTTAFVGREAELARMADYLETPACRLLTLVGLGGIGKTRLVLQAARQMVQGPAFSDGVFFVPLAAVGHSADLPGLKASANLELNALVSALAGALNFSFSGSVEPKMQLLNYLQAKETLLILDNFEELLISDGDGERGSSPSGAGDLVVDILRRAPGVKLLVTSSERLNLEEEWVLEVEGLAYPKEDWRMGRLEDGALDSNRIPAFPPSHSPPSQPSSQYSAITLFMQQARRVQADFSLSPGNQAEVVRLCQLVNGMPLALKLAAAWLPLLSCAEIVAEIERDLDFLATSLRNVPERHRSIRAVLESSWNLLLPAEQQVLKWLSVFQSGFSREAAIQVANASFPMLLKLLNKSLLRRDATGRYSMHELVRQYCAEKLALSPSEKEEAEQRHGLYYAEFMEQRDKLLFSPRQLETIREIGTDLKNILAAWRRAVEQEQVKQVGQFMWSLWFFYEAGSRFYEGVEVFAGPIERWGEVSSYDQEKSRVYARALVQQGSLYMRLTQPEPARLRLERSLPILKQLGAQRDLGLALQTLGLIAWEQGQYGQARPYFEEGLTLARVAGDSLIGATCTMLLGIIAYTLGEYVEAEQLLRQSVSTLREVSKLYGLAFALTTLSSVVLALGRPAEARQLLQEELILCREIEDRWGTAQCLNQLGAVLASLGEAEQREARQLQQESLAIFREISHPWGVATALNQLGQTHCALGEYQEAQQYLQQALQIASENQLTPVALDVLVSLVAFQLQARPGEVDANQKNAMALEYLTLVLNHPASERASKDRAARLLVGIEGELSRSLLEVARQRGQTRSLEAVIDEIVLRR